MSRNSDLSYEAEVFVADAMMIGPQLGTRLAECANGWGRARRFLLGPDSLALRKLGLGGMRSQQQTMIGYELETESYTISIPTAKIA